MSFEIHIVHGGLSGWKEGPCVSESGKKCGFEGTKKSRRSCTNPMPAFGGDQCKGELEKTEKCPLQPCPRKFSVLITKLKF